jgi:hypothetical protein
MEQKTRVRIPPVFLGELITIFCLFVQETDTITTANVPAISAFHQMRKSGYFYQGSILQNSFSAKKFMDKFVS